MLKMFCVGVAVGFFSIGNVVKEAEATSIVLDMGPVGPTPFLFESDFTDLNGTNVAGQAMSLDFLFADSKRVVVKQRSDLEAHGVLAVFDTNYGGVKIQILLPGTAYLLDRDSEPLTEPITLVYEDALTATGQMWGLLSTGRTLLDPFSYSGVHYDFTFFSLPAGAVITGGGLAILGSTAITAPEPSILLLIVFGFIGLLGLNLSGRLIPKRRY